MARKREPEPVIDSRQFRSLDEIDQGVAKLRRRIADVQALDIEKAFYSDDGTDDMVMSNVHNTIREVFGPNSPEFHEHGHVLLWAGPLTMGLPQHDRLQRTLSGRNVVINTLNGLIERLKEKREDLAGGVAPSPSSYLDKLNLHSRIADVAADRFLDGHHWDAVFAASKALINYVKERSGRHDLDGAALMTTVFSKNKPLLAFNDLSDPTDLDEQEGMMHLFLGAVLAIRNPGGHSFPEGSEQRAIEYISLLSTLAYRVQEARKAR